MLFTPEGEIIFQGSVGNSLYFISRGDCDVWVTDQNDVKQRVKLLDQGHYFGEVALLNRCNRTATVRSTNYCTMAKVDA